MKCSSIARFFQYQTMVMASTCATWLWLEPCATQRRRSDRSTICRQAALRVSVTEASSSARSHKSVPFQLSQHPQLHLIKPISNTCSMAKTQNCIALLLELSAPSSRSLKLFFANILVFANILAIANILVLAGELALLEPSSATEAAVV